MLHRTGAQQAIPVALADSAAEAVLLRVRPVVAVVDLRLRYGMTGPEIAHALASLGVPVIVVSGESPRPDLPPHTFLSKPAAPEVVPAQARAAVASRRKLLH